MGAWTHTSEIRGCTSKGRVAAFAGKQCGRVTWAQLRALGVSEASISSWIASGYLIRVLPRVYAVGHSAPDQRARLFSLILFAGPGAALSHGTSAHWRGWLRYPIKATHISTPRRIREKLPGISFHGRRELEREAIDGVPCTTVTQTLLDLAATEPPRLVLRSLGQLDYERRLDATAFRAACTSGKPGSARLLDALDRYIPQLARTRSDLEDEFLFLCQRFKIPLPEVNTLVHGIEVDCHWPELGLVVELDGAANHGTPAQRNRDSRNALMLRSHGLTVLRYTADQVYHRSEAVAAELPSFPHGHARLRASPDLAPG